ncbi:DUF4124 domain-containing protein [Kangiella sp. HZ709]|uniref:DUF4124 domain-containing protein n=1 Tax=Kangiella sp. HZ709 TaxID=2666328 RepID=UPI0018A2006D|nr:DUF4124 domain-containing protein [Kangiella sp. HZ709]
MSLKNILIYLSSALLLATVSAKSSAEEKTLYKKIDKNGRVIFTDKPLPGAKKVVVDTSKNVMAIPKVKTNKNVEDKFVVGFGKRKQDDNNEKTKPFQYQLLSIEKPTNDEAVRANDGNLYIIVAITPMLQREHSIRLLMDGEAASPDQKVPYFSLTSVDRGTHQLTAQVIDDSTGEILQSSESTEFHLLRASRLQNNRR